MKKDKKQWLKLAKQITATALFAMAACCIAPSVPVRAEETAFFQKGGAWEYDTGKILSEEEFDYSGLITSDPRKALAGNYEFEEVIDAQKEASFTSSYDPRGTGYVTSVKNQHPWGLCWDYAAISTAESSLLKTGLSSTQLSDLSELHGAYFSYMTRKEDGDEDENLSFTDFCSDGGNINYIWNIYSRRMGPVTENTVPMREITDSLTIDSSYRYMHEKETATIYELDIQDIDAVKKAITEYGAVAVNYYSYANYYKDNVNAKGDSSYYFPYKTSSINHAVSIIGWDDNFSKDNFANPKNLETDGAWLIKNSWGEKGYLQSEGTGYYWISYDCKSMRGATAIRFRNNGEVPQTLTLSQNEMTLKEGETAKKKLSVTITPDSAIDKSYTFYSTDEEIATVSADGYVTAVTFGECDIIAISNEGYVSSRCHVTVSMPSIRIAVEEKEMYLEEDGSAYIDATIISDTPQLGTVAYKTDSDCISVSSLGKVTAKAYGKGTVKAYLSTRPKIYTEITVYVYCTHISLSTEEMNLDVGESEKLSAGLDYPLGQVNPFEQEGLFEEGVPSFEMYLGSTDIISMENDGTVTGLKTGQATITASVTHAKMTKGEKVSKQCTVTVYPKVESISAVTDKRYIREDETTNIVTTYFPEEARKTALTYSGYDKSIISIDKNGKVTGLKKGQTSVTVKLAKDNTVLTTANVLVIGKDEVLETEIRNAKKETCSEDGYTGDLYYILTGELAQKGEVIPANQNHQWEYKKTLSEADYQKEGLAEYICSQCGETKQVSIPVLVCPDNHELTHVENAKEPTCLEQGYSGDLICDTCKSILEKGVTLPVKTEHKWGEGVLIQKASTTQQGIIEQTCSVCGKKKQEYLSKLEPEIKKEDIQEKSSGSSQPQTKQESQTKETPKPEENEETDPSDINGRYAIVTADGKARPYNGEETGQQGFLIKMWTTYAEIIDFKGDQKKVVIPATVTYMGKTLKITTIKSSAFKDHKKMTSLTGGKNIATIGAFAFKGCTSLKRAVIGKNVKKIGKKAFYKCTKLSDIQIRSKKLTKIGASAFKKISKKAVIKVPKSRFSKCKKLLKGKKDGSTDITT